MDYTAQINENLLKGELSIPLSGDSLQRFYDFVQETCEETMLRMLGVDEFAEFEDSFADDPQANKWNDLWNGCTIATDSGKMKFEGMKKACTIFSYVAFCEELGRNTESGKFKDNISNATQVDSIQDNRRLDVLFNKAVSIYTNAWWLVKDYDGVIYKHIEFRCLN